MIEHVVDLLGWALIDAAWQGVLVGALYAAVRPLLRDAQWRLAAGHLALLALALLPLASLVWRLQAPQPLPSAAFAGPMAVGAVAAVADAAPAWNIDRLLPWLVAAWAIGVGVHTLRLLLQWRGLRRLCARSLPVDAAWLTTLAQLRERLGVRARVRLLHGADVVTPMLVGVLRPTILLPSSLLLQLPRAQVELILIHELAHLRRLDTWFNLLQTCLDTLLFFHPAVHWISRRVREDRELCCDELVLARGGEPMLYAHTLLAMAEAHHRAHAPAPALGAAGGVLMERVQRIVAVPTARQGTQMPALGALLALAALLWVLRPSGEPQLLRDLGLPPLAASSIAAAVPALAGLQFSAADVGAALQPMLQPVALIEPAPETVPVDAMVAASPVDAAAPPTVTESAQIDALPALPTALPAGIGAAPQAAAVAEQPAVEPTVEPVAAPDAAPAVRILRHVPPEYPSHARLGAVEGFVLLSYRVDADGRARDVHVQEAYPEGVFEKAARRALAQWRFDPAGAGSVEALQQFDFRLEGSKGLSDAEIERCIRRIGSRLCRAAP